MGYLIVPHALLIFFLTYKLLIFTFKKNILVYAYLTVIKPLFQATTFIKEHLQGKYC